MNAASDLYEEICRLGMSRQPDFENIRQVLNKQEPQRPTLFEFYHNTPLYRTFAEMSGTDLKGLSADPQMEYHLWRIFGFRAMGYDYVTLSGSGFCFNRPGRESAKSIGMSHGGVITDWRSFEEYVWNEPRDCAYAQLDLADRVLPEGMKAIVCGPGGVLENVIALTGYEDLCFMLADEPELAQAVFDNVGSRLLEYYTRALEHDCVGALISNDDWGFKTQTMLSPEDMRRYVFPWHTKFAQLAHNAGRQIILHSCGNLKEVQDDIIDDIGMDGKHSYEDIIMPVEEAYEELKGRLAVLGGMDLDFMCRSTGAEVEKRCRAMLARGSSGYALGTGNSVPEYIPQENFLHLLRAALDN